MPLIIPAGLRCSECSFNLSAQSLSGGPSMTGFEQVVVNPFPRWRASLTFQVVGEEEILAYNAFLGACQGRANSVRVPPRDGIRPRGSNGLMFNSQGQVLWANRVAWRNGAAWSTPFVSTGIVVSGPYAAGATSLVMNSTNGPGPRPGNYFGIANRLYRVLAVSKDSNGVSLDVKFQPPLREAVPNLVPAILDKPVCTMRLEKDDTGYLSLTWRQPSTPKLDFVEAL